MDRRSRATFDIETLELIVGRQAKAVEGTLVWLRFEDGVAAEVDLSFLLAYDGVFLPLRDPDFFRQVKVSEGAWTVEWPGEVDFDPESIYRRTKEAAGIPV